MPSSAASWSKLARPGLGSRIEAAPVSDDTHEVPAAAQSPTLRLQILPAPKAGLAWK